MQCPVFGGFVWFPSWRFHLPVVLCLVTPWDGTRLPRQSQSLLLAFVFKPSGNNSFAVLCCRDSDGFIHFWRAFSSWFHMQNTLTLLLFASDDSLLVCSCQHWLLEQRSSGLQTFQLWQMPAVVFSAFALLQSSRFLCSWGTFLPFYLFFWTKCVIVFLDGEWIAGYWVLFMSCFVLGNFPCFQTALAGRLAGWWDLGCFYLLAEEPVFFHLQGSADHYRVGQYGHEELFRWERGFR